jgi:WD40 repeat protein
VAAASGELILSDAATGREQFRLLIGPAPTEEYTFSPDARSIAVYLKDRRVILWDLATRIARWTNQLFHIHEGTPFVFHPRDPIVALRTGANQLSWVRVIDGKETGVLRLPIIPQKFIFLPRGDRLVVTDGPRCAVVDAASGATLAGFTNRAYLSALACHPDGRHVVLGNDRGEIIFWNVECGEQEVWMGEPQVVATLAFDPQGRLLVSGHWSNISQLWDASSAQRLITQRGPFPLQFDAEGKRLAEVMGGPGLWQVHWPQHLRALALPSGAAPPYGVAFSPDGRWLASAHANGLRLWDVAAAREIAFYEASGGVLLNFTFDGKSVLTSWENRFWQWPITINPRDGQPILHAPRQLIAQELLPISAAGERGFARLFPVDMKTHFQGTSVYFADLANPAQFYELTDFPGGAFSLSHTTNWLAQSSGRGPQIRQLTGGTVNLATNSSGGLVLLSPDNQWLADFRNNRVEMFSPATGQRLWSRPQETGTGGHSAFSHDSRMLAVGNTSSAQVWLIDSATGEELATLTPQGSFQVADIAFSPDDRTVAIVHNRHIVLWDLPALRRQLAELGLDWPDRPAR